MSFVHSYFGGIYLDVYLLDTCINHSGKYVLVSHYDFSLPVSNYYDCLGPCRQLSGCDISKLNRWVFPPAGVVFFASPILVPQGTCAHLDSRARHSQGLDLRPPQPPKSVTIIAAYEFPPKMQWRDSAVVTTCLMTCGAVPLSDTWCLELRWSLASLVTYFLTILIFRIQTEPWSRFFDLL